MDLDVVWVKLGASICGGDDVAFAGRAASPARDGDLALSREELELLVLTRSSISLNNLAADFVRVYCLFIVEKKSHVRE